MLEGAGRLQEAAANYATMISHLDLTPPPTAEPANMDELQRALNATRVTHALYRAALVNHRLGRTRRSAPALRHRRAIRAALSRR